MDHKIEDLLRLVPKGNWKLEEGKVIDPNGHLVTFQTDLSPVDQKLYGELFVEMLNRVPSMMWTLDAQTERTSAALKEVKHYQGRANTIYNKALEDVLRVIYDLPFNTRTARRTLEELAVQVRRLRKDDTTSPARP